MSLCKPVERYPLSDNKANKNTKLMIHRNENVMEVKINGSVFQTFHSFKVVELTDLRH